MMRSVIGRATATLRGALAAPLLAAEAWLGRAGTERRRSSGALPRLGFGPVPILSFKYMAEAMRTIGYPAVTVVNQLYGIHASDDFDVVAGRGALPGAGPGLFGHLAGLLGRDYRLFAWTLANVDVYHSFFDGGFLQRTPLRFLEAHLIHLAGRRLVVVPYGSDTAIPSRIASLPWRYGLMRSYPHLARSEARTDRWIRHYTAHADFIVGCVVHAETLPRWDLLTTHYYPIDTDRWTPSPLGGGDGVDGPVTVVHAPNHRGMKGTEFVLEACRQLRAEGLDVRLELLEGVTNAEVHAAMDRADIVAEQLLLGYGLTGMEALALGRPVLSNLGDDRYYAAHRWFTGLGDCPIVSAGPEDVLDRLRELVRDPARRAALGAAGRAYAVRFHSYPAMAALWDGIYRRTWSGETLDPADLLPHRRPA